jgi:SAM-dependent methyltransferase
MMPDWDKRYNTDDYVFGKAPNDFLVSSTAGLKPGNALCLAEGEGRNAVYLAGLGFTVTAVDLSSPALVKAHRLARERNVKITSVCADLNEYQILANSWGLIICFFLHALPGERQNLHRRVAAGLRPGGVYILEGFSPEQLKYANRGPKNADQLISLEDAKRELTGLEIKAGRQIDRLLDRREPQAGMVAVTQVLAVKPL